MTALSPRKTDRGNLDLTTESICDRWLAASAASSASFYVSDSLPPPEAFCSQHVVGRGSPVAQMVVSAPLIIAGHSMISVDLDRRAECYDSGHRMVSSWTACRGSQLTISRSGFRVGSSSFGKTVRRGTRKTLECVQKLWFLTTRLQIIFRSRC